MTTELIEKPQAATADLALITLDPAKYVAAVFASFYSKLSAAIAEADLVDVTDTSPAGMAIITKQRAVFRDDIRIAAEKVRVERKAPVLLIGKLLDDENKRIKELAAPYEAKFDAAIKAEEARKEADRQAKIAAERARVEAIQARIKSIRELPLGLVGKPSIEISQMIGLMAGSMPGADFEEFQAEAQSVRLEVLDKLAKMETAQRDIELAAETAKQEAAREAARLAEERAALAKEREEAAALQAKRDAELAAERAEMARKQSEIDDAAAAQAKTDREAREAADALLAQQQEALRRDMAAFQAQKDADAAAKQKLIDDAERVKEQEAATSLVTLAAAVQQEREAQAVIADEIERPSEQDLIDLVTDTYSVIHTTARAWLVDIT